MTQEPVPADPMEAWKQGDFALGVGPFVARDAPNDEDPVGDLAFEFSDEEDGVVGVVAISQTCDMVRETGGRHWITVCPLVRADNGPIRDMLNGRRPYLAEIENAPEFCAADLSRAMSASKDLVRTWDRQDGFKDKEGQKRFAAALSRKYGNFAFPNEFDGAIGKFAKKAQKAHENPNSPHQAIYRSIRQVRFTCRPDWDADEKEIQMLVVLEPATRRTAEIADINTEIQSQCDAVQWPVGYRWYDEPYQIKPANEFTGADYDMSEPADFEYLCI